MSSTGKKVLKVFLIIIAVGMVVGGLAMSIIGCSRDGNYKVVGYTTKEDGYKIEGNKIKKNYKEEALFDDDYVDAGMGFGGIVMMLVGAGAGWGIITQFDTSTDSSGGSGTSASTSKGKGKGKSTNSYSAANAWKAKNSATNIADEQYRADDKISDFTAGDKVQRIGARAFMDSTLSSISIAESVTTFGESAFQGCTKLTSIVLPADAKYLSRALFRGCTSLTEVILPEKLKTINDEMFWGCQALAHIEIPESVLSIGSSAFRKCYALTSIHIPAGVRTVGKQAFQATPLLTEITVDDANDSYIAQGNCLIDKGSNTLVAGCCVSIIPEGVEAIGDSAFRECRSLESIRIPEGVIEIDTFAFYGCSHLTDVTLPVSIEIVAKSAFRECSNLESIKYPGTKAQWAVVSDGKDVGAPVLCNDGLVEVK